MKPLAVDLCCGLGGWSEGLLAEGWDVVGFDVERHVYGEHRYPAQLVLQDIRTIDGRQFKGKVSLIVASPPCQAFSYMAMPWTRAKALAEWYREPGHPERLAELTELFDACVRIGREAECPIIIENVRGAQPWVGRSRWNFGSFHLFGDVPALMPMTQALRPLGDKPTILQGSSVDKTGVLQGRGPVDAICRNLAGPGPAADEQPGSGFSGQRLSAGIKQAGICGLRDNGKGDAWFQDGAAQHGSKSSARKAASAMIAKIPFALSSYLARTFKPVGALGD